MNYNNNYKNIFLFPYSFVKPNTLNYMGITSEYSYWTDISKEEYNSLVKFKRWMSFIFK